MKINYDKAADALYIQLKKGKAYKTSPKADNVLIDFDKKNNAIGIELLHFSKNLSPKDKMEVSAGEKRFTQIRAREV
ncbi:MAG: DUF2283 domain-containing protein [Candidatus Harrisonbacteria bacterium]|nr:DUF2283 domain-containing protein [Candidatus Harrisonbacteria bacterium]